MEPERVRLVLGFLEAGLNPMRAARAAGVSKTFAYELDRKVSGASRLAVKREAAARRAAARAAGPGRKLPPERVRAVLDQLRAGLNPNQAAAAAGVSVTFAYGLHHKMGGVYRPPGTTYSTRYLDREERYEIARLRESGLGMRQVAARLGRNPSTISRELARNACPRTGAYQPERADRLAWERQRRPKPSKLARDPALRAAVQRLLGRRYSPEQASGRLKAEHPDDPAMRVSHESIYQSIYVYPAAASSASCRPACGPAARCGAAAAAARSAAASPARSRSASGPPRPRAAWSPATTKAT